MGVYNPLAKMPQSCWDCFMNDICSKRAVSFSNEQDNRPPCCPLVEVKSPHGDLIDRDTLMYQERKWDNDYAPDGYDHIVEVDDIKNAPTVIKAEVEV